MGNEVTTVIFSPTSLILPPLALLKRWALEDSPGVPASLPFPRCYAKCRWVNFWKSHSLKGDGTKRNEVSHRVSSRTVESSSSPPRNNLTDSLHPKEEEVKGVQRYFSLTQCVTNKTTAGKGSHDDSQRLHKSNRTLHSLLQESSQGWVREPRGKLGFLTISSHL